MLVYSLINVMVRNMRFVVIFGVMCCCLVVCRVNVSIVIRFSLVIRLCRVEVVIRC